MKMKVILLISLFSILLISGCWREASLSPKSDKGILEIPYFEDERNLNSKRDYSFDSDITVVSMRDNEGNIETIQSDLLNPSNILVSSEENSFIIIFEDKPLLEKKKEILEKIRPNLQDEVTIQLSPPEENVLLSELDREIKEMEITRQENINKFPEGVEVKKTFTKSINAVLVENVEEKELNELKKQFKVIPNYKTKIALSNSVPHINTTSVWNTQDSFGNLITGENITIAVLDTGVDYSHPDLGGCFGPGCKVVGGYDFINGDSDPMDDHYHGTHVAATVAGNGSIFGGLDGVAPDAKIYALKVMNQDGSGTLSEILEAYDFIIDLNQNGIPEGGEDQVDIFSMSLGFELGSSDDEVSAPTDLLIEQGLVGVIAAGNSGPTQYTIGSPGAARKAITVGASYNNIYRSSVLYANGNYVVSNGLDHSIITNNLLGELKEVSGFGYSSDFTLSGDFIGKVALIKRGEISFQDKVNNAYNAGAIATIIYNNEPGIFFGTLTYDSSIPAVSISQLDGESLVSLLSSEVINIDLTVAINESLSDRVTSFSSRGPVLNYDGALIKPDILAPGANICAASPSSLSGPEYDSIHCLGNNHISISGTSMATPHVSGIVALILQAHPDWTPEMVKASLLSSTKDVNELGTTQGTGRVDAFLAVDPQNERSKIFNSSLSYGSIDTSVPQIITKEIVIFNPSMNQREYTISTDLSLPGANLIFPSALSVNSNEYLPVEISLTTDSSLESSLHEYKLYISSDQGEKFVAPILFDASYSFKINLTYEQPINEQGYIHILFSLNNETGEIIGSSLVPLNQEFFYSLDPSINYDFIGFIGYYNYLLDNMSGYENYTGYRHHRLIGYEDVNITTQNSITLNYSEADIPIDSNTFLTDGSSLDQRDGDQFVSLFGFIFPNGYASIAIEGFDRTKTYEIYTSNSLFFVRNIPPYLNLTYFTYHKKNNELSLFYDSLEDLSLPFTFTNLPSEISEKSITAPLLNKYFLDLQSLVKTEVAIIPTITKKIVDNWQVSWNLNTLSNKENITTNSQLKIYYFKKENYDGLYGPLNLDFFDPDNMSTNIYINNAYYNVPYNQIYILSLLDLINNSKLKSSLSLFEPLAYPIESLDGFFSETENYQLITKPLFISQIFNSINGHLDFGSVLFTQSLTPVFSHLNSNPSQNDISFELEIYQDTLQGGMAKIPSTGILPIRMYLNGTDLFSQAFGLSNLNFTQPMRIKEILHVEGINQLDPSLFNVTSEFYFNPSLTDNIPPTLIDVDILGENNMENMELNFNTGKFTFTIAEEDLQDVQLIIDDQQIPLNSFGSNAYSVPRPSKTFYENQNSGFQADFSSITFTPKESYEVIINATDTNGNWISNKFYIDGTQTNIIPAIHTIPLMEGWNFISIPIGLSNIDPELLNYEILLSYDSLTEEWLMNKGSLKQINYLEQDKGYVVFSNTNQNIILNGYENEVYKYPLINDSWNFIGNSLSFARVEDIYPEVTQYTSFIWVPNSGFVETTGLPLSEANNPYWIYVGIDPQLSPPSFPINS